MSTVVPFKSLSFSCVYCKKAVSEAVKQTVVFFGQITKTMWCPHCQKYLKMKYKWDEDGNPHVCSLDKDDNPVIYSSNTLTARPRGK